MTITIADRKVAVSGELHDYAKVKCEKLDRYFDRESTAHVTFQIERGRHIAEITVKHAGYYFRAQESSNDMYKSIDGAIDSIEKQIQKNKTKLEKKLRNGAFEAEYLGNIEAEEISSVVKVKEFDLKPMTVEDAILQMELLNHEFFFFKNSEENEKYCIVYKRDNGGFGLIVGK
ncbi:MAG: ribosome-associated translation inhibitor RaiA [Clostridia bacterium]|nr:ribosome-associated translation inhibitor RaiA [Clostridia bacterium]